MPGDVDDGLHPVISLSTTKVFMYNPTPSSSVAAVAATATVVIDGSDSHNHKGIPFSYKWLDVATGEVVGSGVELKTKAFPEGPHSVKLVITDTGKLTEETLPFAFYVAPYSKVPGALTTTVFLI